MGSWLNNYDNDLIIEIKIFEQGVQTQKFKCNSKNYPKIINLLEHKFGLKPFKKKDRQEKKDWLNLND